MPRPARRCTWPLASAIGPWIERAGDGLRLPPHSIEAEQSVLGGLMLDSTAWDQIADRVIAEDFYRNDHRLIFAAVAGLIERNQPCDAVTLSGHLESQGLLDQVGGLAYLGSLARDTPTAANIRAYADIVRERSVLRQLITAGNLIVGSALEPEGREAREIVDEAERAVFEIAERGSRGKVGFRTVKSILPDVVNRIDELYHSDGKMTGISTGFKQLDEMTSGLQPGDLIIIAGRPSMGKTTLAVNIAENAALGSNKSAAIFSMEMSAESLTLRMISSLGRINQSHLRSGRLHEDDWPRIDSAMTQLGNANIFVDETPALTPTEIRARARRLKRERGLDLDRRGLSAAHAGRGHQGKSRHRDFRDLAVAQGARQGIESTGHRPVAAQSRRRTARREEAGDVGSSRMRHRRNARVSRRRPTRTDSRTRRPDSRSLGHER